MKVWRQQLWRIAMSKVIIDGEKHVTDRDLSVLDEFIKLMDSTIHEINLALLRQKKGCVKVIVYEHGEECADLKSCRKSHCVADCDKCSDTSESCFIVSERNAGICASCEELCEDEEDVFCYYGEHLHVEISELEYRRDSLIRIREFLGAFKMHRDGIA